MSDFLDHLVSRAFGPETPVRPRPVSRFEQLGPTSPAAGAPLFASWPTETWTVGAEPAVRPRLPFRFEDRDPAGRAPEVSPSFPGDEKAAQATHGPPPPPPVVDRPHRGLLAPPTGAPRPLPPPPVEAAGTHGTDREPGSGRSADGRLAPPTAVPSAYPAPWPHETAGTLVPVLAAPAPAPAPVAVPPAASRLEPTAVRSPDVLDPTARRPEYPTPPVAVEYQVAHRRQDRPPPPAPLDAAPVPTINVTIGRIEVRATATSAPAQPSQDRSEPRVLALEEYLRQRAAGGSR